MKIIFINSLKECCKQYKDNRYFHSNIEFIEPEIDMDEFYFKLYLCQSLSRNIN